MATRALVLGGGGPVGVAWESGLVAGLAEQGVQMAEADLFVGTSAGSVVGSQLSLSKAPQELYERQIALAEPGGREQRNIDFVGGHRAVHQVVFVGPPARGATR